MVHTSPLDQAGTGDAGGMNIYVCESAQQMAAQGIEVDIFTRRANNDFPDVVDLGKGGKSHWALLDPCCCEPEFFPLVVLQFLNGKGCVVDIIQKNNQDSRNLIFVIKKLKRNQ